jgi:hypothetical protein
MNFDSLNWRGGWGVLGLQATTQTTFEPFKVRHSCLFF